MLTMRVPNTQGSQKRALDLLELELRRAISSHVGARNGIQVLGKGSRCSQSLSCLFNPAPYVLKGNSDVGYPEKIIGVNHTETSALCYPMGLQED